MTDFGQTPFGAAEFAENPEPRCPCLLLLDTSGSMSGQRIKELNAGLAEFKSELMLDSLAAKRVEVASLLIERLNRDDGAPPAPAMLEFNQFYDGFSVEPVHDEGEPAE